MIIRSNTSAFLPFHMHMYKHELFHVFVFSLCILFQGSVSYIYKLCSFVFLLTLFSHIMPHSFSVCDFTLCLQLKFAAKFVDILLACVMRSCTFSVLLACILFLFYITTSLRPICSGSGIPSSCFLAAFNSCPCIFFTF